MESNGNRGVGAGGDGEVDKKGRVVESPGK